jgi:hypothetical protein
MPATQPDLTHCADTLLDIWFTPERASEPNRLREIWFQATVEFDAASTEHFHAEQDFDVARDASAAAHVGDPKGQLLAWLRHVCDFKANEAERGCGLANAAVELPDPDHPARRVIREYKTELRERLIRLCRDARLADPERLADQVFLICEGARVTAQSVGTEGLSARLAGMLEARVADHARRGKQNELDGRIRRGRRKS